MRISKGLKQDIINYFGINPDRRTRDFKYLINNYGGFKLVIEVLEEVLKEIKQKPTEPKPEIKYKPLKIKLAKTKNEIKQIKILNEDKEFNIKVMFIEEIPEENKQKPEIKPVEETLLNDNKKSNFNIIYIEENELQLLINNVDKKFNEKEFYKILVKYNYYDFYKKYTNNFKLLFRPKQHNKILDDINNEKYIEFSVLYNSKSPQVNNNTIITILNHSRNEIYLIHYD